MEHSLGGPPVSVSTVLTVGAETGRGMRLGGSGTEELGNGPTQGSALGARG